MEKNSSVHCKDAARHVPTTIKPFFVLFVKTPNITI